MYCEKLHANRFENTNEIDKHIEIYKMPNQAQKER